MRLHMHDPREPHFSTLKRILRYVRGYCDLLVNNLLAWSSKPQPTLSRSSEEAEYRGVANAVVETCWLCKLLHELHTTLSSAMLVYCDNVRVLHVPFRYHFADIFTKGLPSTLFEEFRSSLSVRCPPAQLQGSVSPCFMLIMSSAEPIDVRRTTIRRLRQELVVGVELANNLLHELNRYLEQLRSRALEFLRVESLPEHPLIKYGFNTLERASFFDMSNSNNLVIVRIELLRSIADKEEMINHYRTL
nr:hypothetical protein [Tanacetum cinerariifolium]